MFGYLQMLMYVQEYVLTYWLFFFFLTPTRETTVWPISLLELILDAILLWKFCDNYFFLSIH